VSSLVEVGEIVGAFGVLGWVKVRSYTDPPANILKYNPWALASSEAPRSAKLVEGRPQGAAVVARLEGVDDRDQAIALKGTRILVPRQCFPEASPGTYYWADLIGLDVVTVAGVSLGKVRGLLETGANDVLDIKGDRDRLIPFVVGEFVKNVNLVESLITVDWDPEF
jgi:16S rRNA processing protein RimM